MTLNSSGTLLPLAPLGITFDLALLFRAYLLGQLGLAFSLGGPRKRLLLDSRFPRSAFGLVAALAVLAGRAP
jgi:hypothetical protein